MIWCHITRATYGALLSVGFRTTSRFVQPAIPSASPIPCPPVSCTSKRNSVVPVTSTPVSRVRTREVASCASGERLFGPRYGERNVGCHCEMKFDWPEIQKRLDSECGKRVVGSLEEEASPGA